MSKTKQVIYLIESAKLALEDGNVDEAERFLTTAEKLQPNQYTKNMLFQIKYVDRTSKKSIQNIINNFEADSDASEFSPDNDTSNNHTESGGKLTVGVENSIKITSNDYDVGNQSLDKNSNNEQKESSDIDQSHHSLKENRTENIPNSLNEGKSVHDINYNDQVLDSEAKKMESASENHDFADQNHNQEVSKNLKSNSSENFNIEIMKLLANQMNLEKKVSGFKNKNSSDNVSKVTAKNILQNNSESQNDRDIDNISSNTTKDVNFFDTKNLTSNLNENNSADTSLTSADNQKKIIVQSTVDEDDKKDAEKCIKIAKIALDEGNIEKAKRFLSKAERKCSDVKPIVQSVLKDISNKSTKDKPFSDGSNIQAPENTTTYKIDSIKDAKVVSDLNIERDDKVAGDKQNEAFKNDRNKSENSLLKTHQNYKNETTEQIANNLQTETNEYGNKKGNWRKTSKAKQVHFTDSLNGTENDIPCDTEFTWEYYYNKAKKSIKDGNLHQAERLLIQSRSLYITHDVIELLKWVRENIANENSKDVDSSSINVYSNKKNSNAKQSGKTSHAIRSGTVPHGKNSFKNEANDDDDIDSNLNDKTIDMGSYSIRLNKNNASSRESHQSRVRSLSKERKSYRNESNHDYKAGNSNFDHDNFSSENKSEISNKNDHSCIIRGRKNVISTKQNHTNVQVEEVMGSDDVTSEEDMIPLALRCLRVAKKAFGDRNFGKAEQFINYAKKLNPRLKVDDFLSDVQEAKQREYSLASSASSSYPKGAARSENWRSDESRNQNYYFSKTIADQVNENVTGKTEIERLAEKYMARAIDACTAGNFETAKQHALYAQYLKPNKSVNELLANIEVMLKNNLETESKADTSPQEALVSSKKAAEKCIDAACKAMEENDFNKAEYLLLEAESIHSTARARLLLFDVRDQMQR